MAPSKGKKKNQQKKEATQSLEPDSYLYFGQDEFTLPNGDTYSGNYCAHRYGLIWREGHGIYTTKDGQTYEGEWKDDKLVQQKELEIKFPSGDEFRGCIAQDKYAGAGIYTMENKMDISCEFTDNKPRGNVILIDINGRVWEGPARENNALLLPENQFYFNIRDETGVGKLKSKSKQEDEDKEENVAGQQEQVLSDRELERIIFAKTKKTLNDIDFSGSKWCQRYLRYRSMKDKIAEKLIEKNESARSLTNQEKAWYKKYQKHKLEQKKKNQQSKIEEEQRSHVDTSLLDTFYSKQFKESCPPLKVFYPRCDSVENYLETLETNEELEDENVKTQERKISKIGEEDSLAKKNEAR